MFRRLSFRITLLSVILLVVLYTISSIAVFAIVRGTFMRGIDLELVQTARQVLNTPSAGSPGVYAVSVSATQNIRYVGLDGDGEPVIPSLLQAVSAKAANSRHINFKYKKQNYRAYYIPARAHQPGLYPYLVTFTNDTSTLNFLARLKRVIFIVGVFGLAGATLVGFILAERMLRPIRKAWRRQLEFVADASHELRTPLAVIQSNLGIVMEHTDESVTENLEWLNNAHGESRRLSKLVQDLLTLARSDSERLPIERDPVNLKELIEHVQELYETIAEMKEIKLGANADEDVVILGDRDRLHQLLVILLDNAVKFTEPGGSIDITLTQQRTNAVIAVADSGLGIAKENLGRVFDRFFTVDPARSRENSNKGTGLGLAIAAWVTESHGGKISIHSAGIGQGTIVRVELPLPQRHQKQALIGAGN